MTAIEAAAQFNLYLVREFFDARTCAEIIDELCHAPDAPATVYGQGEAGAVDERVRKVARLTPANGTLESVRRRLHEGMPAVAADFGSSLSRCQKPRVLRYGA